MGKKNDLDGEKICFRWGKPIVTPMGKLIEKMIYIHGGLQLRLCKRLKEDNTIILTRT